MSASPFRALDRVLRLLTRLDIPHALIGGWAVVAWGVIRTSEDFDLMVELSTSRRKELLAALAPDYDATWLAGGEDDPVPGLIRAHPHAKEGFPVDFLVAQGADRRALSRAIEVEVEGGKIPIVRPEDLIAMKLSAGGGQDYEDARRLLSVLSGKLDEQKLSEYCRERKVTDRLALLRR
jgi:predicted nucleotidyltransferase